MPEAKRSIAKEIRATEKTHEPVETSLATDERVLARITDGIYRRPDSALRELISNAYDADATEVVILTDAPRFSQISIRDDGLGLTPEVLEHLVKHIGGSAKREEEGPLLGITAKDDPTHSPSGRQLIGKMGIGLFSVAQFTRHFLIITKTKGDTHQTIADITLGPVSGQQKLLDLSSKGKREIVTGHARIWRERAPDKNAQGTEIKLLELLPRTRAELASDDLWARLDFEKDETDAEKTPEPGFHVGRMKAKDPGILDVPPRLPWKQTDKADQRFSKFVEAVLEAAETENEVVDLDRVCDRYFQSLWTLSLCAPLEYYDVHPFDLSSDDEVQFFEVENRARGQATPVDIKAGQTARKTLKLKTPSKSTPPFKVFIDGVQLFRPIIFHGLPRTESAVRRNLLFIGRDSQKFEKKPIELSGGPLNFEAYLFWSPRIVPKQHQGVLLRVGNASGALFDRTFMGYQVSEQTRTRQITAEIFVHQGLDGAINIDRESFNYAHPHYQYLVKWLHSALRQLANRHKNIGSEVRAAKLKSEGKRTRERIDERVEKALKARGIEDVPAVILLETDKKGEARKLRSKGSIPLLKETVLPASYNRRTGAESERQKLAERKAIAITQLLHGWGLLEKLSFQDQAHLIRDIVEIVLLEG